MPLIGQTTNEQPADTTPSRIRPYTALGCDLHKQPSNDQMIGDCPFCGKESKFSVQVSTGKWRCYVCYTGSDKGGGNLYTFIRKLHEMSITAVDKPSLMSLAQERGLMSYQTLIEWGICRSVIDGEWLIPAYSHDGHLNQLYRYTWIPTLKGPMQRVIPTPKDEGNQDQYLYGIPHYDANKEEVWLMEGVWDALAVWEVLRTTKKLSQSSIASCSTPTSSAGLPPQYSVTGNLTVSLYSTINVLAVPSANVFSAKWCPLFEGKNVVLMYDNDHPKSHKNPRTGQVINTPPVGYEAMRRVAGMLAFSESPPTSISFLRWGQEGEKYNPNLPDGYDMRDLIRGRK